MLSSAKIILEEKEPGAIETPEGFLEGEPGAIQIQIESVDAIEPGLVQRDIFIYSRKEGEPDAVSAEGYAHKSIDNELQVEGLSKNELKKDYPVENKKSEALSKSIEIPADIAAEIATLKNMKTLKEAEDKYHALAKRYNPETGITPTTKELFQQIKNVFKEVKDVIADISKLENSKTLKAAESQFEDLAKRFNPETGLTPNKELFRLIREIYKDVKKALNPVPADSKKATVDPANRNKDDDFKNKSTFFSKTPESKPRYSRPSDSRDSSQNLFDQFFKNSDLFKFGVPKSSDSYSSVNGNSPPDFFKSFNNMKSKLDNLIEKYKSENNQSKNILIRAIMAKKTIQTIKDVINSDPKLIYSKDSSDNNLIHLACLANYPEIIELLSKKLDPNHVNAEGYPPIGLVSITGSVECLKALEKCGADIHKSMNISI